MNLYFFLLLGIIIMSGTIHQHEHTTLQFQSNIDSDELRPTSKRLILKITDLLSNMQARQHGRQLCWARQCQQHSNTLQHPRCQQMPWPSTSTKVFAAGSGLQNCLIHELTITYDKLGPLSYFIFQFVSKLLNLVQKKYPVTLQARLR